LLDKGNNSKALFPIPLTIRHEFTKFTISLNKLGSFINEFVTS